MKYRIILLVVLATLTPTAVWGQIESCDYARCALRLQQGFLNRKIVAGEQARNVAKISMFGTDLEKRVTLQDSALLHVRRFNRVSRISSIVGVVGAGLIAAGAWASSASDGSRLTLTGVGFGMLIGGSIAETKATNHLQEALWWYNREFAR